jgi:hypothetical protein
VGEKSIEKKEKKILEMKRLGKDIFTLKISIIYQLLFFFIYVYILFSISFEKQINHGRNYLLLFFIYFLEVNL